MTITQVKHYIVKETGDPAVDRTDVVDRGWAELWIAFSKSSLITFLLSLANPTLLTRFKWTEQRMDIGPLIQWLVLQA